MSLVLFNEQDEFKGNYAAWVALYQGSQHVQKFYQCLIRKPMRFLYQHGPLLQCQICFMLLIEIINDRVINYYLQTVSKQIYFVVTFPLMNKV